MRQPHAGATQRRGSRRKADGDCPVRAAKRELNVPRLVYPTSRQTSVTGRFPAARSRSAVSMRRRVRKSRGVSPKTRRKRRWKRNGERDASRAARSSVIGSQKDAARKSRARQSRRNVTSSTRGIGNSVSQAGEGGGPLSTPPSPAKRAPARRA